MNSSVNEFNPIKDTSLSKRYLATTTLTQGDVHSAACVQR